MDIIAYSVWVDNGNEIDVTRWELEDNDEMERFVGAQESVMVFPIVDVTVI
jgi:hypothetical protein